MARRFGWHSGTLKCKDIEVEGDIYVQDDIIFSDVSAGVLGVTGGIDMADTTSAIGIDMGGTHSTAAINIDGTSEIGVNMTKSDSSGTAGAGGYGAIKYVGTFTADAASAHKGIFSQVDYEPPSDDGTACSIGVEGQVTAKGDLSESNNYPGYGYGIQGKFHLKDGATINSGDLDPGSTYAGVRAVLTDAGSATLTKGTFAALVAESQVSQDADNTDFRTYLGWFRCQGSTTSTDITAGIRIESGDAWGNNILKGISMRDFVDAIHLEPAGSTNFINASAESGCVGSLRGTPNQTSTCDGSLTVSINGSTLYIPLFNAISLS